MNENKEYQISDGYIEGETHKNIMITELARVVSDTLTLCPLQARL